MTTTPAVVTCTGLTKTFGSRRGIADVDLDVADGEVFGFLGPNGAGKSTTIRLMTGLVRPTSGRVEVFGLDPLRDVVAVHRRVGYLPGELSLYPAMTGREHLERLARGRGLVDTGCRDALVERFRVELDGPARTLSKGNRQKIGLVAAFMHQPDLLVLDEPTSGLDPLLQLEFERLLGETVAAGRTVFLSSHVLDEVQRTADRVAIIKDGRVVVVDTVDHLRQSAPRTIEFTFAGSVDPHAFSELNGVQVRSCEGGHLRLTLTGAVAPVLRVAAALDPLDVVAHPADLDELFLTYYRTDNERDGGQHAAGSTPDPASEPAP